MSVLLRYFKALQQLSKRAESYITSVVKTVELSPGQSWEIDRVAGLLCIRSGLVKKVSRRSRQILRFLREGEGMTMLAEHRFSWVYVAVEPTVIEYIVGDDIQEIYEKYPLANRLATVFMTKDMMIERQHFASLVLDSTERYDMLMADYRRYCEVARFRSKLEYRQIARYFHWLLDRVPMHELADYLDMSERKLRVMSGRTLQGRLN